LNFAAGRSASQFLLSSFLRPDCGRAQIDWAQQRWLDRPSALPACERQLSQASRSPLKCRASKGHLAALEQVRQFLVNLAGNERAFADDAREFLG